MKRQVTRVPLCSVLLVIGLGLTACQADKHTVVDAKSGTTIVCRDCYDQVYAMQHFSRASGGGGDEKYLEAHTQHACPSCDTVMSLNMENGIAKIKCAKCAPEGVACDKCLPPKEWVPPANVPSNTR